MHEYVQCLAIGLALCLGLVLAFTVAHYATVDTPLERAEYQADLRCDALDLFEPCPQLEQLVDY